MELRRAGKGHVLGVKSNQLFHSWGKPWLVAGSAKDVADDLPAFAWRRLSAGAGTKGERLHDWASLELSDLDAGDYNEALTGQAWTRGLLIRRKKRRRRPRLLHDMGSAGNDHRKTGENRTTSLGDRRQFRNDEERTRPRSQ
jgi:SRSO17 transposase